MKWQGDWENKEDSVPIRMGVGVSSHNLQEMG